MTLEIKKVIFEPFVLKLPAELDVQPAWKVQLPGDHEAHIYRRRGPTGEYSHGDHQLWGDGYQVVFVYTGADPTKNFLANIPIGKIYIHPLDVKRVLETAANIIATKMNASTQNERHPSGARQRE